jgi:hypothetical protein
MDLHQLPLAVDLMVGQNLTDAELRFLLRCIGIIGESTSLLEIARMYGKPYEVVRKAEERILLKLPKARLERTKSVLNHTSPSVRFESLTQVQYDALYKLVERALLAHDLKAGDAFHTPETRKPTAAKVVSAPVARRLIRPESRASRMRAALSKANRPMHYRALFEHATIPSDETFTPELAYQVVYQDANFRMIGNGVVALAEWKTRDTNDQLRWCPLPPMPLNARADTFFETLLLLRNWLIEAPRTVGELIRCAAERWGVQIGYPQDALDVWYAAGLIMPADAARPHSKVQLMLPKDVGIRQARQMCVEAFTTRVALNDRLLGALDQLEGAPIERLQNAVYGEADPFDLPYRMTVWESLGIVLAVDRNRWQLTPAGHNWLFSLPPQVFSMDEPPPVESEMQDDLSWLDVL